MAEILNLIVSSPCGFGMTDFHSDNDDIVKAKNEGHKVVPIMYFHGKVESEIGYDIGVCINGEEISDNEDNLLEGIYDAKVKGYNGNLKAFLWNDGTVKRCVKRGLIVNESCKEDMKYARKCYFEREEIL